jgi:hypothetical protein
MTREFCARLKQEFPEALPEAMKGYHHWQFNYEQFAVRKLGECKREPLLDEIIQIAKTALLRVRSTSVLESDLEVVQGLGKGDVLIIPGYQSIKTSHAIGLTDLDIKSLRVFFSTSWHSNYHITPKQIDRYVSFAKMYFEEFY